MRLFSAILPMLLKAQADPVFVAYQDWEAAHRTDNSETRTRSLLEVSAQWVAKWPNSTLAWNKRRTALIAYSSEGERDSGIKVNRIPG